MNFFLFYNFGEAETIEKIVVALIGILWIITYVLIVIQGLKDKSYGLPWPAVCFNLAWEFIFGFTHLKVEEPLLTVVRIWFFVDLLILVLVIRFGQKEEPTESRRKWFKASLVALLASAFALEYSFILFIEGDGLPSSLVINLLMALLFLSLLFYRYSRPSQGRLRGLSYPAAWTMTIANVLVVIAVVMTWGLQLGEGQSPMFLLIFSAITAVANVVYLVLFHRARHGKEI